MYYFFHLFSSISNASIHPSIYLSKASIWMGLTACGCSANGNCRVKRTRVGERERELEWVLTWFVSDYYSYASGLLEEEKEEILLLPRHESEFVSIYTIQFNTIIIISSTIRILIASHHRQLTNSGQSAKLGIV